MPVFLNSNNASDIRLNGTPSIGAASSLSHKLHTKYIYLVWVIDSLVKGSSRIYLAGFWNTVAALLASHLKPSSSIHFGVVVECEDGRHNEQSKCW